MHMGDPQTDFFARLQALLATTAATRLRERLAQAGLAPAELTDQAALDRLPVLRKEELIALQAAEPPFGGLLGVPLTELERVFQSPGPIYDPQGRGVDYWGWRPALAAAGFGAKDVVIVCFSYHLTPAGQMFDDGVRALGATAVPGGIGNQEQQLALIAHLGVSGYIGLPSYLNALLELAAQRQLALRLSKAFVTAEPLPPSLRAALETRGIRVSQGYGTADLGCVAYECEQRDGLHVRDDLLVEICDPSSGQPLPAEHTGEIVVTTLNPTYPLVRFGTGDLSAMRHAACPCGRPTPRLLGIRGRLGQGIKVRGLFVYPHQLQAALATLPGIAAWSGRITRVQHRDELTVQFELAPDAPPDTLEQARQRLQAALKLRCSVEEVPAGTLAGAPPLRDERVWE